MEIHNSMDNYNRKQEMVNGLIHSAGILFGIAALPTLIGMATLHNNKAGIIGTIVFGFCFLLVFAASTIYHLTSSPKEKRLFKKFDHISIYFFIAGTYTPFLLLFMNDSFGTTLLVILWVLTIAGTLFKIYFTGKYEILSTIIYLAMGWIMLVGGHRFFDQLPAPVLSFVIIGAILYSVGVIFYIWDKYMYTHAVWHGFVLSAAILHYVAVLLAVT